MSNGDAAPPPALRTLRFGDRTISYDHVADDGAGRGSRVDDENVGGKTNSDVEPEDEAEGRQARTFDCAFSLWMLGLHQHGRFFRVSSREKRSLLLPSMIHVPTP